jgi:hypothetical protein
MKSLSKTSVFFSLLFLLSLIISGCSSNLVDQLRAYETAHNNHDIDQILSLVTDDIEFHLVGAEVSVGKQQIRWIEEWGAAVNSQLTFTDLKVRGNTLTCQATEKNDLFKLYGLEEFAYKSVTFIFHDGLIQEIRVEQSAASSQDVAELRQAFIEWASQERSQKLEELMPQGEAVYHTDNAGAWLALLREWREETDQE